ncbi:hypothetical protein BC940DRAFT_260446, partial [Gongronella butleri]
MGRLGTARVSMTTTTMTMMAPATTTTTTTSSCVLSSLPLDVLLKMANYLDFSDLWYLATASKSCRRVAHHIIWHKYGIDLYRPRLNAFNHLVHGAVAYLHRNAWSADVSNNGRSVISTNHQVLQAVANRLAVEIYDRTPLRDWEHGVDFLVDKTLGILMDHVLTDPGDDAYLKRHPFRAYPMGKLVTDFLATFQPTLAAVFDDHVHSIHHRLLLNHLQRHFELLTQRYHYHHKRRLQVKDMRAWQLMNGMVRRTVRVLVRFIGALAQTELLTANDLYTLTHERIFALFLAQQYHQRQDDQIRNTMSSLPRSGWMDEIEFQMIILFDLARAVSARQCTHRDAQNEVNSLANMFKIAVSDFLS